MPTKITNLFLFLSLATSILAIHTTTVYYVRNPCTNGTLTRITNTVRNNFDHQASLNAWTLYPGLELRINVTFQQYVAITYQIGYYGVAAGGGVCYFATRVFIDNEQAIVLRNSMDTVAAHFVDKTKQILMKPGVHYNTTFGQNTEQTARQPNKVKIGIGMDSIQKPFSTPVSHYHAPEHQMIVLFPQIYYQEQILVYLVLSVKQLLLPRSQRVLELIGWSKLWVKRNDEHKRGNNCCANQKLVELNQKNSSFVSFFKSKILSIKIKSYQNKSLF